MQGAPKVLSVAGLPAVQFRYTAPIDGTPIGSRLIYAFGRTTEYLIICRHSQRRAAEVERGCDQVVATFKV
jgi:hypothetical protein